MKSLVIYDSVHGNTKAIAQAIAKELGGAGCVGYRIQTGASERDKIFGRRQPDHRLEAD